MITPSGTDFEINLAGGAEFVLWISAARSAYSHADVSFLSLMFHHTLYLRIEHVLYSIFTCIKGHTP